MESIQTAVEPVTVEIDGVAYAVAEKTVAVAEALLAAQRRLAGKPEYQLWLAELEVLLGRAAVKRLFHRGRRENIDRMQQIYAGVCAAFEQQAARIERQQAARRAEALQELSDALEPLNELLRQLARLEPQPPRAIHRDE